MPKVIHSNCRIFASLTFLKAKCGRPLSTIKSTRKPSEITCHQCLAIERAAINEELNSINKDRDKLLKRLEVLGDKK